MALGKNMGGPKMGGEPEKEKKTTITNQSKEPNQQQSEMETKNTNVDESLQAIKDTVDKSFARIEFESNGTITDANDNFVNTLGYNSTKDLVGNHHSMFVDTVYKNSTDYKKFWADLANGITQDGEFKRVTRDGKEVWIQAAYTPVREKDGSVSKVIKIATDITAQVLAREEAKQVAEELKAQEEEIRQQMEEMSATAEEMARASAEMKGLTTAIDNSFASIEFDTNGNILTANQNFLNTVQYSLDEIKGKHHRIFVDKTYANTPEYGRFWIDLANGKENNGQFKRITSKGEVVWLQAVYSPVKDSTGKVIKVIKIATDITAQALSNINMAGLKATVDTSYASIEFDTKGNILDANMNFVKTLGYDSTKDIIGGHHSMFVEAEYKRSADYSKFWNDLANGITQEGEFKRIARDGREVWIQAAYTPVRDQEGNVFKVIKIASNITKSKEDAAQQQREIDARSASVDQACIVSEVDLKGYITYVNDKHCEVSGYTREELMGANQNIVRHPDMPKSLFKEMWATIGKGQIFRGLVKNRKKDGTPYYVDGIFTPIMGANGKPIKYVGIRFDITETTFEQQRMKGVTDAIDSSYGFIEFDIKGNIQTANENFLKLTEYSLNDLSGKHHRMFVDRAYSNSSEYARFWDDLAAGIPQVGQYKRFTRSGKEIWIQAVYSPVKDDMGRIIKVVKIATDITGQKKVLTDVQKLVEVAGVEGKLTERLSTKDVDPNLAELVGGMNGLLDSISTPILAFGKIINKMAQGDLTDRYREQAQGDIKDVADSLNSAQDNLNKLLGNISQLSHIVGSSAEEMMAKGDQMGRNTQEMASAIQQMAEGAQQQAQQTDEVSKLVDGVLKAAGEMSAKSEIINKAAERGQESSNSGLITIKKVVENMNEIQASAKSTSESIVVLTQRSEEIASTLNVITDIASQTNLLALNAAIEAARAGDAGRGFAVVAEEIRKLAEDSRKSAIDIARVIREVQKDVTSASKAIDSMDHSVKSGNTASKEAESVFQSISVSSNETLVLSKEILISTGIQKEAMTNTVKAIEKIVVVSEETAAGTEQIATSSKELSGGMTEVGATSKDLADVATQLMEGVAKFKIDLK